MKDWVPDKDILGSTLRYEKLGDFGGWFFGLTGTEKGVKLGEQLRRGSIAGYLARTR